MSKIEGNTSHLAGRMLALRTVYKFSVDIMPIDIATKALSPAGHVTTVQGKGESDLANEAQHYPDSEAFREGYAEEFNAAMALLQKRTRTRGGAPPLFVSRKSQ